MISLEIFWYSTFQIVGDLALRVYPFFNLSLKHKSSQRYDDSHQSCDIVVLSL